LYNIKVSKLYDADVDSCYDYINDTLENPIAAENLIKNIIEALLKISENPKIRPLVRDEFLASLGYRLINVKNYMIFYIIDEPNNYLKIVRFLYGKRDWMNILKENTVEELFEEN